MDPESVDVTAGLGGFLAFFILAVALYFLMRNMNARMRRMAYREEQAAALGGAPDGGHGPDAGDGSADGETPEDHGPDSSDSSGPSGGPKGGPDLG